MSKTEHMFRTLLRRISSNLLREDFTRNGTTFIKAVGDVQHFIDFQRSEHEAHGEVNFTINVGILSQRLHKANWPQDDTPPTVWHCHVTKRIGFLVPRKEDRWWIIRDISSINVLYAEIAGLLEIMALPFTRQFNKDKDVRQFLWNALNDGIASYEDVGNLCVLDALIGKDSEFVASLKALKKVGVATGLSEDDIEQRLVELIKLRKH